MLSFMSGPLRIEIFLKTKPLRRKRPFQRCIDGRKRPTVSRYIPNLQLQIVSTCFNTAPQIEISVCKVDNTVDFSKMLDCLEINRLYLETSFEI